MALSSSAALWFLIAAIPVALWVSYADMATMKIPNKAVLTLFAGYVVLGLIALPLNDYLWGYSHMAVILAIGIAMNAAGLLGAGDAKFAAAAAPMVALGDASKVMYLFALCLLGGFMIHRLARATPLRRMAPHWASWDAGRKFPMGLPLALTLLAYLALAATTT